MCQRWLLWHFLIFDVPNISETTSPSFLASGFANQVTNETQDLNSYPYLSSDKMSCCQMAQGRLNCTRDDFNNAKQEQHKEKRECNRKLLYTWNILHHNLLPSVCLFRTFVWWLNKIRLSSKFVSLRINSQKKVVIFSHRHQWIWTFRNIFRKIWKRILISLRFRGLKVSKIEKKSNFFLIAASERWESSVSLRRNYHFWTPKNALPESKGL